MSKKELPCSDYAELTPDEQGNVWALWDSVALSLAPPPTSVVPNDWIADTYCWDDVHEGGWGCEQCYREYDYRRNVQ